MPFLDKLELMDLTADDRRSDIVPVYRKAPLPDAEFRILALKHLCSIATLPLDFTSKVTVRSAGVIEGLFGVLKSSYTVNWKIQKGDYKIQTQVKNATFDFFDNIYAQYGNLPEQLLEELERVTDRYYTDKGIRKAGYITKEKADFLIKDILLTRSSPDTMKEMLLSKLKDGQEYESGWRYSDNSVKVAKVVDNKEPYLIILALNYLEWEYEGMQGTLYYNPSSSSIISLGLPEDEELKRMLKAAEGKDDFVLTIFSISFFVLLGIFIFIGIKGLIKWYMCIVWFFAAILILGIIVAFFAFNEDRMKSKWEKQRTKSREQL